MSARRAQNLGMLPDPNQLAGGAINNPRLLPGLFEGLKAESARVKYAHAKAIRLISEQRPELLYPHFETFVQMLDHENKIFQWDAAYVLSHLARVDSASKFSFVFQRYFRPIPGPVMITAATVIQGGARIAQARPEWADQIAGELLKVARARYRTPECRNVALGHAILAFREMLPLLCRPAPVVSFVRKQLKNPRPATRKKAELFLKSHASA